MNKHIVICEEMCFGKEREIERRTQRILRGGCVVVDGAIQLNASEGRAQLSSLFLLSALLSGSALC